MDSKLEKRVLSRLNAQYIFMPVSTGRDICEHMRNILTIPGTAIAADDRNDVTVRRSGANSNLNSDSKSRVKRPRIATNDNDNSDLGLVSRKFAQDLNASVANLFGTYVKNTTTPLHTVVAKDSQPHTDCEEEEAENGDENDIEDSNDDDDDCSASEAARGAAVFVPGELQGLIDMHREWGRDTA